jgi:hypothetical protein
LKDRSTNTIIKRNSPFRNTKKSFLIICEGETEIKYFHRFRLQTVKIKIIEGKQGNAKSFILEAIKIKKSLKDKFDESWCVFDKDNTKDLDFIKALRLAKENNLFVAFSIIAFEVWLLLHFKYFTKLMSSDELIKDLSNCLKFPFTKQEKVLHKIFKEIQFKEDKAIENARKMNESTDMEESLTFEKSFTTVHLLVIKILGQIQL